MNQFLPKQRQTPGNQRPNPNFNQQQPYNESYHRQMDYYPNQIQPTIPNQMPNQMQNGMMNPSQQPVFNPMQNQGNNYPTHPTNSYVQNQMMNPTVNQGTNFIPNQANPIQNQGMMANSMRNQGPNPNGNQVPQQMYNHIPNAQPNSMRNQMPNQMYNQTPYPNQRKAPSSEPAAPKENFIKKLLSKKEEPQFEYDPILGYRKLAPKAETASILKKIAEPATLDLILSNTERVLQTAQQIGPLIEQYGPMVKSIPDLISSFTSDSKESAVTKILKTTKNKKETIIEPEYEPVDTREPDVEPPRKSSQKGPKLFV